MKQTSDKSEQAIRQLSDKFSEISTEEHITMIDPDSYPRKFKISGLVTNFKHMKQTMSEIITEAHTTMIEMSAKFQVWSQILNT